MGFTRGREHGGDDRTRYPLLLENRHSFLDQLVIWEGSEMPIKPVQASVTTDYHIAESMAVEEHTDRTKKILDAKHSATDLEKVCSSQSHLEVEKQQQLLTLLRKFEDLFNGTLGKWNEEPIKLELKADATS
jgi:hypothetical protein